MKLSAPPALNSGFFMGEGACEKIAKQNEGQPIENKRLREIHDSLLLMISMAYDQPNETLRFVWQMNPFEMGSCPNWRWSWRVWDLRAEGPRNGRRSQASFWGAMRSGASRLEGRSERSTRSLRLWSVLRGRSRGARRSADGREGAKKLRKRALKPLKQLARVNLCAPPREPRSSAAIGSEADDSR
jgi:hypothetical protein